MLPSLITGSVETGSGAQPFVLRVSDGSVITGRFELPSRHQRGLAPDVAANIERRVRAQLSGVRRVRLGWFRCGKCARWVDVAADPGSWSKERCSRCA